MPPFIAGGVVRYAVNASYAGHTVVNILDVHIDQGVEGPGRDIAAEDEAGNVLNGWTDNVLPHLSNLYSAESVSWIDLDNDTGSVGVRTSTDDNSWPEQGAGSWEAMPGNVALRVNKNTNGSRGQRQGRMYLAGFSEGGTNHDFPNQVEPAVRETLDTAFTGLLDDVNQENGAFDPDLFAATLVVVHTKLGAFTNFTPVDSMSADPFLSSQVRRIRR